MKGTIKMTITEMKKDLFTVSSDYMLAHCISADFVLGAGIAVAFNKFFNMKWKLNSFYPNYMEAYNNQNIGGDCILIDRVFNLITKERCYHKPTLDTMKTALMRMKEICLEKGFKKIAMPKIGCGLDKLQWEDVKQAIIDTFSDTDIEILVCSI